MKIHQGRHMQAYFIHWLRCFSIILLLAGLLSPQQSVYADRYVNDFYQELAPWGAWFDHNVYGRVWQPRGITRTWRPYTEGHWIHTATYGWYWQAEEPWGYVPFHYGRWAFDNYFGWLWIPGSVWAPAWVSWQYNDGYYAWAPLPPEIYWQPNRGLSFSYSTINNIPNDYWVVVPQRYFINQHLHQYALPVYQNRDYLNHAHNHYSHIRPEHHQITNPGVPYTNLHQDQQQRLQTLSAHETETLIARPIKNANGDLQYVKPIQQPTDNAAATRERELALRIMRETKQQQDVLGNNKNIMPAITTFEPSNPREQDLRAMQQQADRQRPLPIGQVLEPGSNSQELGRQQMLEQQRQLEIQRQREVEQQQQILQDQQAQQQMQEQQRQLGMQRQREVEMQQLQEQQRQQAQQAQQQMREQQRQLEVQRQQEVEMQQQQQLQERQRQQDQQAQQQMREQQRQLEVQQQREVEMQQQQVQERQRQQEQQMLEQQRLQAQQQQVEQQRQQEMQRQLEMQQQMAEQQRQAELQQQAQRQMQEQQRQLELQRQQQHP